MVQNIMKVILMLLLFITSIQDLVQKKVSLWILVLGAIGIGVCTALVGLDGVGDRLGGLMVGVAFMGLSKITQGKVGMGDGIILCVTGMALGFWMNLELLVLALFVAAAISIILLILRLANRKSSIPFIPFLFTSYIILLLNQT